MEPLDFAFVSIPARLKRSNHCWVLSLERLLKSADANSAKKARTFTVNRPRSATLITMTLSVNTAAAVSFPAGTIIIACIVTPG